MSSSNRACVAFTALVGLLTLASLSPALADMKDYEFKLVKPEVKKGNGAIIAVHLVDKRTNRTMPGAVIFAKRIDMAPDGMATHVSPLEEVPSDVPGEYRFKANLTMAGRWQLSLGAKMQGEAGTLQSKLVLKATP
jgi:hypothetical protein